MTDYVIGDVHGCYDQLRQLLNEIDYQREQDRLYFVGDLVNRGPDSAKVLLFIMQLPRVTVVLGNHDLHLIALYYGVVKRSVVHPLQALLQHERIDDMVQWLCQQPVLHWDADKNFAMVHAGVPPQWSLTEASRYARELETVLQSSQRVEFLQHMYGDQPQQWSTALEGWDRLRYITNAFTRMRFCTSSGQLNLSNKTDHEDDPQWQPWFRWYSSSVLLCFGHWAALNGASTHPLCQALDTGCVWGNALTAMRLSDRQWLSVPGWKRAPVE